MSNITKRLSDAITAVCPIDGLSILDQNTKSIKVQYKVGVTLEQQSAAQQVIANFDWTAAGDQDYEVKLKVNFILTDIFIQFILSEIQKAVPGYTLPTEDDIKKFISNS